LKSCFLCGDCVVSFSCIDAAAKESDEEEEGDDQPDKAAPPELESAEEVRVSMNSL
jgi:hypothetical protein